MIFGQELLPGASTAAVSAHLGCDGGLLQGLGVPGGRRATLDFRRMATRLKLALPSPSVLPGPRALPPWSGRQCAPGGLRKGTRTQEGVACTPPLGAPREGRLRVCSAPAPLCSSISSASACSSLPSKDAQDRADGSCTHLTRSRRGRPGTPAPAPLWSQSPEVPGAGRGEHRECRLSAAPPPPPPAGEQPRTYYGERSALGAAGPRVRHWLLRPAAARPAPPLGPRPLAASNRAALTCGGTPGSAQGQQRSPAGQALELGERKNE